MIVRRMHRVHSYPAAAGTLCACPCFMQLHSSDDEFCVGVCVVTHPLVAHRVPVLSAALAFSEFLRSSVCVVSSGVAGVVCVTQASSLRVMPGLSVRPLGIVRVSTGAQGASQRGQRSCPAGLLPGAPRLN